MKKNKKIYKSEHKQVKVIYGKQEIKVDKDIAPLLQELWKANHSTIASCQGNKKSLWHYDFTYIMFNNFSDLEKFMFVYMSYLETESFQTLHHFHFEVQPRLIKGKLSYFGIVRFPKKYIKKLTKAFIKDNELL